MVDGLDAVRGFMDLPGGVVRPDDRQRLEPRNMCEFFELHIETVW